MRFSKALHVDLMLLQLKYQQKCSSLRNLAQCAIEFCKNCHSVSRHMKCNHLTVGPLNWSLAVRGKCCCCFALAVISKAGELCVFVLDIVKATAVCESRLHLGDTDCATK